MKTISLEAELRDAYEGQGNASRMTFEEWLENMAGDPRGTLNEAAQKFLGRDLECLTQALTYGELKEFKGVGGKARLQPSGKGYFIGPEHGLDIGQVHLTASQDAKVQEGYARLFAAAPDLLAALKQCLPLVASHVNMTGGDGLLTLQVAYEAIAKATGAKT